MNRETIAATLARIDLSSFPIPMKLSLNPEAEDGLTRVSAALAAPDTKGLKVATGLKAGGFWPAHSVVVRDETETVAAAREAVLLALGHEVDEHLKLDGKFVRDPHPAT